MNALDRAIALVFFSGLAAGPAGATTTTNYSDQWWVPAESGWGASVQQQADTIVVGLLVYGSDGQPRWFSATAPLQAATGSGHDVFAGDLHESTGPWFGTTFNPALVTTRKVGALTFDATSFGSATLSYTIDGAAVVKSVARQTWAREDLSGHYKAVWNFGCSVGIGGTEWGYTDTVIRQNADETVTMEVSPWATWYFDDETYHLTGTYAQSGHLGMIKANLDSPAGTMTIVDIEPTAIGFTARISNNTLFDCPKEGRIVGIRD